MTLYDNTDDIYSTLLAVRCICYVASTIPGTGGSGALVYLKQYIVLKLTIRYIQYH